MMCSGSEINRVEEMFIKPGTAYDIADINVFVIPSVITITIRLLDGFELTQTRRVPSKKVGNNFWRLERLNDISHKCRQNDVSLEELSRLISDSNKSVPINRFLLGSVVAAASFCVFFGGNIVDGSIAAIFAAIVCFFQRKIAVILSNRILLNFICALTLGLIGGGISYLLPSLNTDKVLIGNVMLLVPGIATTVSVRDIFLEDTISGILRLVESLFLTGGLALGFWVSFFVTGG
ncbi:MAG: threonine/serine exporter family protein, partial [Clostridia bacterium]|nr:threonine/serine exporter family protein [Clostridia bacterium]